MSLLVLSIPFYLAGLTLLVIFSEEKQIATWGMLGLPITMFLLFIVLMTINLYIRKVK